MIFKNARVLARFYQSIALVLTNRAIPTVSLKLVTYIYFFPFGNWPRIKNICRHHYHLTVKYEASPISPEITPPPPPNQAYVGQSADREEGPSTATQGPSQAREWQLQSERQRLEWQLQLEAWRSRANESEKREKEVKTWRTRCCCVCLPIRSHIFTVPRVQGLAQRLKFEELCAHINSGEKIGHPAKKLEIPFLILFDIDSVDCALNGDIFVIFLSCSVSKGDHIPVPQ